jgi:hypothetical protein
LPECQTGATQGNVSADCWELVLNSGKCAQYTLDQYIEILHPAGEAAQPVNTQVQMECLSCTNYKYPAGSASPAAAACNY